MASPRRSLLESVLNSRAADESLFNSEYLQYRLSLRVVMAARCLVLGAFAVVFITYFYTNIIVLSVIGVLAVGYVYLESSAYKHRIQDAIITRNVIYNNKIKAEVELGEYARWEERHPEITEIDVNRLGATIQHLQNQLQLAAAELQIKNVTIETQQHQLSEIEPIRWVETGNQIDTEKKVGQ